MAEQFENNYSTLLNGAIDSDDTTLVVDAAPTTMTGEFRIKIDDELILVGAVSGTSFTGCTRGVEGTTAASHSDNAPVTHVLTTDSLYEASVNSMSEVLGTEGQFLYMPITSVLVKDRTGSGSLGGGYTEDTGQSFSVTAGKTYRVTLTGSGGGTLNMGMRFDPGNTVLAWYTGPTVDFVAPVGTTTGLLVGRNNGGSNLSWTSYTVTEINSLEVAGFDSGTIGRDLLATTTASAARTVLGISSSYLGYNTVGGTQFDADQSLWYAKRVTTSGEGILQSIECYFRETADSVQDVMVALMEDNSSVPGKFLATNRSIPLAPTNNSSFGGGSASIARWLAVPLTYQLAASTSYWIAVNWSAALGGGPTIRMYRDGSGSDRTWSPSADFITDGGRYTETNTGNQYSIRALVLNLG